MISVRTDSSSKFKDILQESFKAYTAFLVNKNGSFNVPLILICKSQLVSPEDVASNQDEVFGELVNLLVSIALPEGVKSLKEQINFHFSSGKPLLASHKVHNQVRTFPAGWCEEVYMTAL